MSLFISALQTSPKFHINIKKHILKILTVIYRDFTHYSRNSVASSLTSIWNYFNSILPLFIQTNVYDYDLDDLDDNL